MRVPTALICSTAFTTAARILAQGLGVPDLRIATIPHPFSWSGLTPDDISKRVTDVFDQVVMALTRADGIDPGAIEETEARSGRLR